MTEPNESKIDWSLGTWTGSRRKQHQEFHAIPFSRKLEIIEEMNRSGLATLESRRKRGLSYIDPYTDKLVRGTVREQPESDTPGIQLPKGQQVTRPNP